MPGRATTQQETGDPAIAGTGDDQHAQARADSDVLIADYRTILTELALLTTVSVLLFGFLLSNAGRFSDSMLEEWLYSIATVLVASSTLVFVLPVAYHHLQFPYHNFPKFQARSHRWVLIGLPVLGAGLYLSLCLALWGLLGLAALFVAGMPIIAAVVVFVLRKGEL